MHVHACMHMYGHARTCSLISDKTTSIIIKSPSCHSQMWSIKKWFFASTHLSSFSLFCLSFQLSLFELLNKLFNRFSLHLFLFFYSCVSSFILDHVLISHHFYSLAYLHIFTIHLFFRLFIFCPPLSSTRTWLLREKYYMSNKSLFELSVFYHNNLVLFNKPCWYGT